jgi:transcriptional regulator with XRE-family HTH domain
MSVLNAGSIIREARLKAGLTQEQLSEGVCSSLSLSRIETGTAGVSPSTFQSLMAHAGAPCEAFPAFANRADFDCFYTLKRARFYLDSWQLTECDAQLESIENMRWSNNRFYYQEWLYLHCKLQFRSGHCVHQQIFDLLLDAIHISRPHFDTMDFHKLLLSITEIELCTLLAQEALYLGKSEMCLNICNQLSAYLSRSEFSYLEKDRLLAEHAIVYTQYLLSAKDYQSALHLADMHRRQMAANLEDAPLHELTFLTAISHYHLGNLENALLYFKVAFFSAHSIESTYATICLNYVKEYWDVTLPEDFDAFEDIPLRHFAEKKAIDTSLMGDGTYDDFSSDILTIGSLIHELRLEQKLSQQMLCQGLCSKSKLSKIENGTLQPEIILAQTLLQRLGISDQVFTFYGDSHETALQEYLLRIIKTRRTQIPLRLDYLNQMDLLCTSNDSLYQQFILFEQALCQTDATAKIIYLQKALALTMPDFDFKYLPSYRLSWMELSILNHICSTYAMNTPSKGILRFYNLPY